jgi:acyl carrier protein
MNREEVFNSVQGIFRDVFDQSGLIIKDKTSSSDIEDWDSLNQINLVVAMEKEFQIKFALADIENLKDVGEMVDLIFKKIKEK